MKKIGTYDFYVSSSFFGNNLSTVYVKKGDKVKTKEELGEIFTNVLNNQTLLKFYLYQDTSRLNPEEWIYQL